MTQKPVVLVVLKSPIPGFAKTRLAATIGPVRAAELYCSWVSKILHAIQPIRSHASLIGYFAGDPSAELGQFHALLDLWRPQPSGDLGDRLRHGFSEAFQHADRVVAIGADCLDVSADTLVSAFAELESADAVFGPARDGGYYLVGLSRPITAIFDGVRWSSADTLADHLANCRNNGWTCGLLETKSDIDTWDDWLAYCAEHDLQP